MMVRCETRGEDREKSDLFGRCTKRYDDRHAGLTNAWRTSARFELLDYDSDKRPLFAGLSVVPQVIYKEPPTGPNAGDVRQHYLLPADPLMDLRMLGERDLAVMCVVLISALSVRHAVRIAPSARSQAPVGHDNYRAGVVRSAGDISPISTYMKPTVAELGPHIAAE